MRYAPAASYENGHKRTMRIVCLTIQVCFFFFLKFPGLNVHFHPSLYPFMCLRSHADSGPEGLIDSPKTKTNPFQLSSPSALSNVTTGKLTDVETSHS